MDGVFESDGNQTLKGDNAGNQILKDDDVHRYDCKVKDDLRIFCYEMYHYFMARRFCLSPYYPEIIPVTERSQFTEEFGKAVLFTWHNINETSKIMLDDDYPRYMERTDNFKAYVMIKVKEIINGSANGTNSTLTQQIILMTVFLFDIYIYCYKNGCSYTNCFLPHFVTFWTELFLKYFYERFKEYDGWKDLSEQYMELSEEYDKTGAEKSTKIFRMVEFNPKYFKNDESKNTPGYCKVPKPANECNSADSSREFKIVKLPNNCKLISRFYTDSNASKKTLPPYRGSIRERKETLNIIFESNMHQEILELDRYNCFLVISFAENQSKEKSSKKNQKKKQTKKK